MVIWSLELYYQNLCIDVPRCVEQEETKMVGLLMERLFLASLVIMLAEVRNGLAMCVCQVMLSCAYARDRLLASVQKQSPSSQHTLS